MKLDKLATKQSNMTVIGNCDNCGNEDAIDCETGLCPDCLKDWVESNNLEVPDEEM